MKTHDEENAEIPKGEDYAFVCRGSSVNPAFLNHRPGLKNYYLSGYTSSNSKSHVISP